MRRLAAKLRVVPRDAANLVIAFKMRRTRLDVLLAIQDEMFCVTPLAERSRLILADRAAIQDRSTASGRTRPQAAKAAPFERNDVTQQLSQKVQAFGRRIQEDLAGTEEKLRTSIWRFRQDRP
ncbi:hypothetical protein ACM42_01785 [Bradyrhizobium sp. CCBAU 25338]|nr:hypothetical protein [Bradyrhizobium sp. CCBAU 25338]